MLITFPDR